MFTVTDRKLAEIALEATWITLDRLKKLVPACRTLQKPLAVGFREAGMNEDQITFLQACALQLPFVQPDRIRVTQRAKHSIPVDVQQRYRIAPVRTEPGIHGETVYAAMLPEVAAELASHLSQTLGMTVIPVAASARAIGNAISRTVDGITDMDDGLPSAQELDLDTPASPAEAGFLQSEMPRQSRVSRSTNEDTQVTSLADF